MFKSISNALLASLLVVSAATAVGAKAMNPKFNFTTSPERKVGGFIYQVMNGDTQDTITYMIDGKEFTLKPNQRRLHYSDLLHAVITLDLTTGDDKFVSLTGTVNVDKNSFVLYSNYGTVKGYTVPKFSK